MCLSVLIFSSCEKDPGARPSTLVLGDANADITPLGIEVWGGYNQTVAHDIDLDNNGAVDIRIATIHSGSPASGVRGYASISSLHDQVQIANRAYSYSVFETTYQDSGLVDPFNYFFFTVTERTCDNTAGFPFKEAIDGENIRYEKAEPFSAKGDFLDHNDASLNTETGTSSTTYPPIGYPQTRTITNNQVCNHPDYSTPFYTGIKIGDRLGWVKLERTGDGVVYIHEYAIQK